MQDFMSYRGTHKEIKWPTIEDNKMLTFTIDNVVLTKNQWDLLNMALDERLCQTEDDEDAIDISTLLRELDQKTIVKKE